MAPKNDGSAKKVMNKGAWTAEEDSKLSQYIEIHGAKRWKTIAAKAGNKLHTINILSFSVLFFAFFSASAS